MICKSNGGAGDAEKSFHKVILTKYGGKIRELYMDFHDDELLTLIEQKCCSLKSVHFYHISRMPMLMGLQKIHLPKVQNLNRETFTEFINNNQQLESLRIEGIQTDLLNMLDGRLDMLKELKLYRVRYSTDSSTIQLKSLERLIIDDVKGARPLLQSLHCNAIKELNIQYYNRFSDGMLRKIGSIKTLVSLRLHKSIFPVDESQLQEIAAQLPHLTEFSMKLKEGSSDLENKILSVLSILPTLIKLKINLNNDDFNKLLNDLKTSVYDFHGCFAKTNIELEISYACSKVSTSKDHICVFNSDLNAIELHWMDNLDERSVRRVIGGSWNLAYEFKFINNCANQTLDVTTFMHSNFERTRCLAIKSNGPITVNASVSEIINLIFNFIQLNQCF